MEYTETLYFSENGPITIRELFDEYSDDITLLQFLIQQEPYVISEEDKKQNIITNNKEPSLDASKKPSTFCRDCCRKKHLQGNPPKSNCKNNVLPPLSPNWIPENKWYEVPQTSPQYQSYPWCCDPAGVGYIPTPPLHRHNGQGIGEGSSKYVDAMSACLSRKGVNPTQGPPNGGFSPETAQKVQDCLNEVRLMWESQVAKDAKCADENRRVKNCIAACLMSTTIDNTPTAAGCGETPIRQSN